MRRTAAASATIRGLARPTGDTNRLHQEDFMTTRLALALLVAASGLRAQAPERFPLPGDAVAVYNLAGMLRVEAGSGADVIVELTARRRDAAKLK